MRTEGSRAPRRIGAIGTPVGSLRTKVNVSLPVTVRRRLVKQAQPILLVVSSLPYVFVSRFMPGRMPSLLDSIVRGGFNEKRFSVYLGLSFSERRVR